MSPERIRPSSDTKMKRGLSTLLVKDRREGLTLDALVDCFVNVHSELNQTHFCKERNIKDFVEQYGGLVDKVKSSRLARSDFETLKVIGRGAFGEVHLVKCLLNDKVYALKIVNKWDALKQKDTSCFIEERNVLVGGDHKWITELYYTFQDDDSLYFLLEYYPGGDLLTLLSKFEDGRMPEDMVRFYAAEMVEAIASVHEINYIHRDVKPDNFLLTRTGHLRLADFGSSRKIEKDAKAQGNVAVGTPDYISPEVLSSIQNNDGTYGVECDWWSFGVCVYEMLFGETPFYSETLVGTYAKILDLKRPVSFPSDCVVSDDAKDLIRRLCCDRKKRMTLSEIKAHPFFTSISWSRLHLEAAPYAPEVASNTDTSNFEEVEDSAPHVSKAPITKLFIGNQLAFVNFSFSGDGAFDPLALSNARVDGRLRQYSNAADLQRPSASEGQVILLQGQIKELEEKMATLSLRNKSLSDELSAALLMIEDDVQKRLSAEQTSLRKILALEEEVQQYEDKCSLYKKDVKNIHALYAALQQENAALQEEVSRQKALVSSLTANISNLSERSEQATNDRSTAIELAVEDAMKSYSELKERLVGENSTLCERVAELESRLEETEARNARQRAKSSELASLKEELGSLQSMSAHVDRLTRELAQSQGTATRLTSELEEERAARSRLEDLEAASSDALREVAASFEEEKLLRRTLQDTVLHLKSEISTLSKQAQQSVVHDIDPSPSPSAPHSPSEHVAPLRLPQIAGNEGSERAKWINRRSVRIDRLEIKTLQQQKDEEVRARLAAQQEAADLRAEKESEIESVKAEYEKKVKELEEKVGQMLQEKLLSGDTQVASPAFTNHFKSSFRRDKGSMSEMLPLEDLHQEKGSELVVQSPQTELDLSKEKKEHVKEISALPEAPEAMKQTAERAGPPPLNRKSSAAVPRHMEEQRREASTDVASVGSLPSTDLLSRRRPFNASSHTASHKVNMNPSTPKSKHTLMVHSFKDTTQCQSCTSLMRGSLRQGVKCTSCAYVCHRECVVNLSGGHEACPLPTQAKKAIVDIATGTGTYLEGWIHIPKPGGIRKGWARAWLVVWDCMLAIFHRSPADVPEADKVLPHIIFIVDLRNETVKIGSVSQTEAIHVPSKDLSKIMKVSSEEPEGIVSTMLIMCESSSLRDQWVHSLATVSASFKKVDREVAPFASVELVDHVSLPDMRRDESCFARWGSVLFFGCASGLFSIDMKGKGKLAPVGDIKKVTAIEILPGDQYMVVSGGKSHQLRIYDIKSALRGRDDGSKIAESKGLSSFTSGLVGERLCVAICMRKKAVLVELVAGKPKVIGEASLPANVTFIRIARSMLCVGHDRTVTLYEWDTMRSQTLVSTADPSLRFLTSGSHEALPVDLVPLMIFAVPRNANDVVEEFLLCYNHLGIFVNHAGLRSREIELRWTGAMSAFSLQGVRLLCLALNHIEVYDVKTGRLVQVMGLERGLMANPQDLLYLCSPSYSPHGGSTSHDPVSLIMLRAKEDGDDEDIGPLTPLDVSLSSSSGGRRFTLTGLRKKSADKVATKDRSMLISAPTDFQHVSHITHEPTRTDDIEDLARSVENEGRKIRHSMISTGNPKDENKQVAANENRKLSQGKQFQPTVLHHEQASVSSLHSSSLNSSSSSQTPDSSVIVYETEPHKKLPRTSDPHQAGLKVAARKSVLIGGDTNSFDSNGISMKQLPTAPLTHLGQASKLDAQPIEKANLAPLQSDEGMPSVDRADSFGSKTPKNKGKLGRLDSFTMLSNLLDNPNNDFDAIFDALANKDSLPPTETASTVAQPPASRPPPADDLGSQDSNKPGHAHLPKKILPTPSRSSSTTTRSPSQKRFVVPERKSEDGTKARPSQSIGSRTPSNKSLLEQRGKKVRSITELEAIHQGAKSKDSLLDVAQGTPTRSQSFNVVRKDAYGPTQAPTSQKPSAPLFPLQPPLDALTEVDSPVVLAREPFEDHPHPRVEALDVGVYEIPSREHSQDSPKAPSKLPVLSVEEEKVVFDDDEEDEEDAVLAALLSRTRNDSPDSERAYSPDEDRPASYTISDNEKISFEL